MRRSVLDATVQLVQGMAAVDRDARTNTPHTGLLRLWASIVLRFIQDPEPTVHDAAMSEVRCVRVVPTMPVHQAGRIA